jgi:hypothetical protein
VGATPVPCEEAGSADPGQCCGGGWPPAAMEWWWLAAGFLRGRWSSSARAAGWPQISARPWRPARLRPPGHGRRSWWWSSACGSFASGGCKWGVAAPRGGGRGQSLRGRLFLGPSPAALRCRRRVWRGAARRRVVQHATVPRMASCCILAARPPSPMESFPFAAGLLGGLEGGASRLRAWARLDLPSLAGRWCGLGQIERDLARAILLLSVPGSASLSRVVLAGESGCRSLSSRQWGPPCDFIVGWLSGVSPEKSVCSNSG